MRSLFAQWWRWPWMVLAGIGIAALAWRWLAPAVAAYIGADLSTRDQYSSVYALPVGVASLLVSILGPILQARQDRRAAQEASAGPVTPPAPGMASLAVPDVGSAEQVRGRNTLITELVGLYRWRARREPRVRVLHGMGGVGKTTVAVQVAHRVQNRGVTVWWISAAEATDLQTGMRQLARRLGATAQELDRDWADNAPDVLWRRLAAYPRRWLLVIDNADDPRLLAPAHETVAAARGWIRPITAARGALLVTSRDGDPDGWGTWCHLHPVETLSTTDGARVLLGLAGHRAGTEEQAAALAARLGGLPLALTLAGRYLADANRLPLPGAVTTFAAYQAALTADGLTTVFSDPDQPSTSVEARRIIARTWELSLTLLEHRGLATARTLLRLLSVLADAPIPYQLILDPAVLAVSPLFTGIDAAHLRGLLHALGALSLLDLTTNTAEPDPPTGHAVATLRLHPLIRDASLHHLHTVGQAQYFALAAQLLDIATTYIGPHNDPAIWPTWQLLAPHPLHLLTSVTASTNPDPEAVKHAVRAALRVTEYLAANGLYTAAMDESNIICETCREILGAEHPIALDVRVTLARWTGFAGNAVAARDQLAALLPLHERILGPEHPDTLTTRHHLARWTGRAGDEIGARDQFAALLSLRERILGAEDPFTLATRVTLAYWTGRTGNAVAARDQYTAVLLLRERILGAEHLDTLSVRASLAYWTGNAGDAVAARDQYTAVLLLRKRILGAEHPQTLTARVNLAYWTGHAGDAVAARDQLAAVLPLRERVSGPQHPQTIDVRAGLARWTGHAGDAVVARDQLAAVLPLRERVSGPEHPDTLDVRAGLAHWTGHAGDAVAARDQLAAVLPLRERVSGPLHPRTIDVRAGLAFWSSRVQP
ncbi:tetratricopeptide repeat protein [Actinoplanes sp. NPDC051513]|uniref:tetratricopeptide repeat protein n=1 Tax=Actinoplanes sp. NPDC051513 TaxID=3363908 RepID=UPI0037B3A35D